MKSSNKYVPIAVCALCGDDAICKATDGTPLCENCAPYYQKSSRRTVDPSPEEVAE